MIFKNVLHQVLGERIKKRRNSININQEELSSQVGISRSTISNIEAGKHNIPVDILYKISEKLNSQIHLLLPTEIEIKEIMAEGDTESQIVSRLERKNITPEDIAIIKNNL